METPNETSASFGSPRALSRRAKGVIAALSAVVTLATGVVSLEAQLSPAHPSTAAGLRPEGHVASAGPASRGTAASVTGRQASRAPRGATSGSKAPLSLNGATNCGAGLHAGPHTSCPFAQNVRDAYNAAPGATASVRVFSPVTGQTYTMSCAAAGSGVTCSGANNASVTWSR
ncbi:MAG: hypothetical protein ACXVHQ_37445 [Solirubrobacteraceae bacterium]